MELNWKQLDVFFMEVTPTIAQAWLEHHNEINRTQSLSVVQMYARDMQRRGWLLNGDSITFDWNGQAINGQHRLRGVVLSGVSQTFVIVTGLDPAVRPSVDIQIKRKMQHALELSGRAAYVKFGTVRGNTAAGIWDRMSNGLRRQKGKLTYSEKLQFADLYADAGTFALNEFGKHKRIGYICVAPVIAAVARAFYHYADKARLARFVEVLCTGLQQGPEDAVVINLREMLGQSFRGVNSNAAHEQYGRTARTIVAYMQGETLGRIRVPTEEPFPLPDRAGAASTSRVGGMARDERGQFDGEHRADLVAAGAHG